MPRRSAQQEKQKTACQVWRVLVYCSLPSDRHLPWISNKGPEAQLDQLCRHLLSPLSLLTIAFGPQVMPLSPDEMPTCCSCVISATIAWSRSLLKKSPIQQAARPLYGGERQHHAACLRRLAGRGQNFRIQPKQLLPADLLMTGVIMPLFQSYILQSHPPPAHHEALLERTWTISGGK